MNIIKELNKHETTGILLKYIANVAIKRQKSNQKQSKTDKSYHHSVMAII